MKKLNLGGGRVRIEGFINVDLNAINADIRHDLNIYPYPFKDNSIDFILASNILEHLDKPMEFFHEIQRILKVGGRAKIRVPHCSAEGGAYGAMDHQNYFHEAAIETVTGVQISSFSEKPFKLIKTIVDRGRYMKWQKRQITWIIQK